MKVKEVEIDNLTTLANFLIKNDGNQIVVESSDFKNTNDLFFFLCRNYNKDSIN